MFVEQKDEQEFLEVTCELPVDEQQCKFKSSILGELPLSYTLGDMVTAKVLAVNKNGESNFSPPAKELYAFVPSKP